MKTNLIWPLLLVLLFLPGATGAAPSFGNPSAPDVIEDLMTNVAKKPPGPVESDLSSQVLDTAGKLKTAMNDTRSVRELIASTFNLGVLEGPLTSIYAEGAGALYQGKFKLNAAGLAQCEDEASSSVTLNIPGRPDETTPGSSPMFGDNGGFFSFVGAKVPRDGQAIATFCVIQQHSSWKVHCGYISPSVLSGNDKDFVVRQFAAFVKKQ